MRNRRHNTNNNAEKRKKKHKMLHLSDEGGNFNKSKRKMADKAQPLGNVIKTSEKGRSKRKHYRMFDFGSQQFQPEDSVLLIPETTQEKPYVAIIKDISQGIDGAVTFTSQWFYRPEEAEGRGGGKWQPADTRELFCSFHRDEVPAESVLHKCIVHFVPQHKQIPTRKQNPGFIV